MVNFKRIQQAVIMLAGAALFMTSGMALQLPHAWADPGVAPMNPAFIEWQNRQNEPNSVQASRNIIIKDQERFLGLTPGPLDFSHLKQATENHWIQSAGKTTAVFPGTYDLRTLNKLTPVRDQNPYGTCWAFAAMAAIESCLMPSESLDFSEKQLAYTAYAGDNEYFTKDPVNADEDEVFDQGGNMWKATALLARWSSPVSETDVPYGDDSSFDEKSVQKHLQHAIYLPNKTNDSVLQFNADNIKSALMAYGAVAVGMYYAEEAGIYNEEEYAYYYSGTETSNHEVNIVGWDDTFSRENFSTIPAGDGAWIVRNSWGENWGDDGYFYISYHDTALDDGVALVVEDTDNYDTIYQYDPLGWTSSYGAGETAHFANIFTPIQAEQLKAVSFYAPTESTHYTIRIYTDCQSTPDSGTLSGVPQSGTITAAGYHTIVLDTPVSLDQNTAFSVVVEINTPGYDYPVPVESVLDGYSENATAQAGQSFVSFNGGSTWDDLAFSTSLDRANVCLKAFASNVDQQPPYIILTDDSAPVTLSSVSPVQVYGSPGPNTITIESGAQVTCYNFSGANMILFAEPSSQFTISRSGATVYLSSSNGTKVQIPATVTIQTLGFSDQDLSLVITGGQIMLGSQIITP